MRITDGIPRNVFSYAHCVREDPKRRGLLYLGTENMVYVSFNDGKNWQPLQTNLPHAPVHWLVVQEPKLGHRPPESAVPGPTQGIASQGAQT